jgi:hypothetical protein
VSLSALADSPLKRAALTVSLISCLFVLGLGVYDYDPDKLRRAADDAAIYARAGRENSTFHNVQENARASCKARYPAATTNILESCANAELFGGFGEISESYFNTERIRYFFEVIFLSILAGIIGGPAFWAVALAVAKYWRWLKGAPTN